MTSSEWGPCISCVLFCVQIQDLGGDASLVTSYFSSEHALCWNVQIPNMCKSHLLSVSLAVVAGFIDLPLDESCLRASHIWSPVTGRRLLEETKLSVPDFQSWPCYSLGARHDQTSLSTLSKYTLGDLNTKVHTAMKNCSRSAYSFCCSWAWGHSGRAISEEISELLYEELGGKTVFKGTKLSCIWGITTSSLTWEASRSAVSLLPLQILWEGC